MPTIEWGDAVGEATPAAAPAAKGAPAAPTKVVDWAAATGQAPWQIEAAAGPSYLTALKEHAAGPVGAAEFAAAPLQMVGGAIMSGLSAINAMTQGVPRRQALQQGLEQGGRLSEYANPVTVIARKVLGYEPDKTVLDSAVGAFMKAVHGYGEQVEAGTDKVILAEDVDMFAQFLLAGFAGKAAQFGVGKLKEAPAVGTGTASKLAMTPEEIASGKLQPTPEQAAARESYTAPEPKPKVAKAPSPADADAALLAGLNKAQADAGIAPTEPAAPAAPPPEITHPRQIPIVEKALDTAPPEVAPVAKDLQGWMAEHADELSKPAAERTPEEQTKLADSYAKWMDGNGKLVAAGVVGASAAAIGQWVNGDQQSAAETAAGALLIGMTHEKGGYLPDSLFKEKEAGSTVNRFKTPVRLDDGSRISGTNTADHSILVGYDENGELFTQHTADFDPTKIVDEPRTARTADSLRGLTTAAEPAKPSEVISSKVAAEISRTTADLTTAEAALNRAKIRKDPAMSDLLVESVDRDQLAGKGEPEYFSALDWAKSVEDHRWYLEGLRTGEQDNGFINPMRFTGEHAGQAYEWEVAQKYGLEDEYHQKHFFGKLPKDLDKKAAVIAAVGAAALLPDDKNKLSALGLLGITAASRGYLSEILKAAPEALRDKALVDAARGTDALAQAAQEKIYKDNAPKLERMVENKFKKQLPPGTDAADVVAEVMSKFLTDTIKRPPDAEGGFRGDAKVSSFLYKAAENRALNAAGKLKLPEESMHPAEGVEGKSLEETVASTGLGPEGAALEAELGAQIDAAMQKLPKNYRDIVQKILIEGQDYETAAAELGVPVGTVRSGLNRAKEAMQNSLGRYERGSVDTTHLAKLALISGGAILGAYLGGDDHKLQGAMSGAAVAIALAGANPRAVYDFIKRANNPTKLVTYDDIPVDRAHAIFRAARAIKATTYEIDRLVSDPARRSAIYHAIIEERPIQLSPTETTARALAEVVFKAIGKTGVDGGVIKDLIDNYATRIYGPKARNWMASRPVGESMSGESAFGKGRKFPTLAEAEAAGFHPVTTDISRVLEHYSESIATALANKKMVQTYRNTLTPEGKKLILPEDKAPADYVFIDHPQLRGSRVNPDIAADLRMMFDMTNPGAVIRLIEAVNTTQKRSAVSFSMFHPMALEQAMLGATRMAAAPIRAITTMAQALRPQGVALVAGGIAGGMSNDEHQMLAIIAGAGAGAWLGKFIKPNLFGEHVALKALRTGGVGDSIDKLARGGLKISFENSTPAVAELTHSFYEATQTLSKYLDGALPGLGKVTVGKFSELNHSSDNFMWGRLQTSLKIMQGLDAATTMLRTNAREMQLKGTLAKPEAQIYKEAASFANDTFGGLNWHGIVQEFTTRLGRETAAAAFGPTGRLVGRLSLFALDWTVSTTRAMLKAFGQLGVAGIVGGVIGADMSSENKTLGAALGLVTGLGAGRALGLRFPESGGIRGVLPEWLPGAQHFNFGPRELADFHRQYLIRSMFVYTALIDGINYADTGHHFWDNTDPTRLQNKDGTWTQVSKHMWEPYHWILDPIKQGVNKASWPIKESAAQILGTEYLSPEGAPRMGMTPKGRSISPATRAAHFVKGFSPIAVQQSLAASGGQGLGGMLGSPTYGVPFDKQLEEARSRVEAADTPVTRVAAERREKAIQKRINKRMQEEYK